MSAVSVSEPDVRPVLAEAADLARRALLELEPSAVGAHLGVSVEDESAATHRFEATLPGYRGWQWAVVVAAPPGADRATVSESALLPGPDALVAPEFVPWEQRIRPGDLAPGDLLAPPQDDPRLVPGYMASGDPEVDEVALEIGLGRTKVLSEEGRIEAAERWYSEYGPDTEMAKAAPSTCGKCGFYLPLAGALRAAFGVCGNAMGADGHVVHVEYGCGAHSDVVAPTGGGSPLYEAYDDAAFDVIPPEELRKGAERSAAEELAGDGVSAAVETADASVPAGEVSADGAASAVETVAVTEDGAARADLAPSVPEAATADVSDEVVQSVPEAVVAEEGGAGAAIAPSVPETAAAQENGAADVRAEIAPSEPEAVAAEAGAGEVAPSTDAGEPGVDTADAVQVEATGTEAAPTETASTATELSADDAAVSADAAVSGGEQADVEGEAVSGAAGIEQAETDEIAEAAAAEAQPEAIADATAVEAAVADAVDAEKGSELGGSGVRDSAGTESADAASVAQPGADADASAGSTVDEVASAPASDALEALTPSAAESVTDAAEGETEAAASDVAAELASATGAAEPSTSGDLVGVDDAVAEGETDAAASDIAAERGSATDEGPESGSSPRN
ncbi:Protein of unknown function (DUF3027) [Nocardia amikacinitolerans]|uniref:DUF3027 domain-containing protein n=1 Tax=Nocardia amikacinitolerans TaxID=756689 RepID=UPI00082B9792|nr:DUF3027 domain-containing protein [Nocardia amikacinitolerans]MCP2317404.1 Protein of unknown function (DUF3027) [Nocardia amikacinitolerans]